jgi:hypothetical protein
LTTGTSDRIGNQEVLAVSFTPTDRKTLGQLILDASIALQHSERSLSKDMQFDLRRLWKLAEALIDVDDLESIDGIEAALMAGGWIPAETERTDYEQ